MGVLRSALVLLAAVALCLSFAVPGEDVAETAYDESESLPYEMPPRFSGDLVQGAALASQVGAIVRRDLLSTPRHSLGGAWCKALAPHPKSDSLILIDHLLRC